MRQCEHLVSIAPSRQRKIEASQLCRGGVLHQGSAPEPRPTMDGSWRGGGVADEDLLFGRYALTTGLAIAMFAGRSAPQLRTVPLGVTSNARPDWALRAFARTVSSIVYVANNDSESVPPIPSTRRER